MEQKYIVGDLVKVWLDLEIKYQVAEVVGYNPTYQKYILTNWYIEETRGCISVAEDRIIPIPLTPEILEKNGWKHKKEFGEYWFVPRNEDYELLALDKVGEEWAIYIEENSSNFENIKFVHQLQHLLFGLGLNSEMEV